VSAAATTIASRRALLDALEALGPSRAATVLVGAQAVYLHTGETDVPIASTTVDADLALVPERLRPDPTLDALLAAAGFSVDLQHPQPGKWLSRDGVPVEFLVPNGLHHGGGRRAARIPPHSGHAARIVRGLEAAAVEHATQTITALEPRDTRSFAIEVAGPAALVVAKAIKIAERVDDPGRLKPKDAHDLFRLLQATATPDLAERLVRLRADALAGETTDEALGHLRTFAQGDDALIPRLAAETEGIAVDAERRAVVSASTAQLARDLLREIDAGNSRLPDDR